ncbi:unnamed protein product [Ilex paraguariensis]|uniref:Uncharacterized protein n=1 Tax=Ilex paraguariensis TaxID=185542 RepID=A0ABC8QLT5_9AQUA
MEGDGYSMVEEGCRTPRHDGCQIPADLVCPPPPRKKTVYMKKRSPPKNGYFQPPDLEVFFAGQKAMTTLQKSAKINQKNVLDSVPEFINILF